MKHSYSHDKKDYISLSFLVIIIIQFFYKNFLSFSRVCSLHHYLLVASVVKGWSIFYVLCCCLPHLHCSVVLPKHSRKPLYYLLIGVCGCGSQKHYYGMFQVHAEMVFKIINITTYQIISYATWTLFFGNNL